MNEELLSACESPLERFFGEALLEQLSFGIQLAPRRMARSKRRA